MSKNQDNHIYSSGPLVTTKQKMGQRFFNANNEFFFSIFDKTINWLIESETTLSIYYNDVFVQDKQTYTDYYGFLSSVTNAINDAKEEMKEFKIDAHSPLNLKLVTSVRAIPVRLDMSHDGQMWNTPSQTKKRYVPLFDEETYCYQYDQEKFDAYIKRMNESKPDYEAYDLISNLRINNKDLLKHYEVGSSQKGLDVNLEALKNTIKFMMEELKNND